MAFASLYYLMAVRRCLHFCSLQLQSLFYNAIIITILNLFLMEFYSAKGFWGFGVLGFWGFGGYGG